MIEKLSRRPVLLAPAYDDGQHLFLGRHYAKNARLFGHSFLANYKLEMLNMAGSSKVEPDMC